MKILLLNTHEKKGGAGVACQRLFKALRGIGTDVRLLVQYKKSQDEKTRTVSEGWTGRAYSFFRFVYERATFVLREKSREVMFAFSPANAGYNVAADGWLKNSDVIHLHWINQGFLSLESLHQLKQLKKPVLWTLHDMWAFTGGCHYSGECTSFFSECMHCPFLRNPSASDLSNQIWKHKKEIFQDFDHLTIVTCSSWLGNLAKESSLLRGKEVVSIPNCVDTAVFSPAQKKVAREKLQLPSNKKLVLFGAMNTSDKRKGFNYIKEALNILKNSGSFFSEDVQLVVFGKTEEDELSALPYHCHNLGIVSSEKEIAMVYSAADVFVIPSLEDNLPNTIMEALACGVPVVGFKTGGIPEMISHKENGYLSDYKSPEDLANGIQWILAVGDPTKLSENARNKAIQDYAMEVVAEKYMQLYRKIKATI